LPNSLALVLLPRLSFFRQGHMYLFSVRSLQIVASSFSWAFGIDPSIAAYSQLNPLLLSTRLHGFGLVKHPHGCQVYPQASEGGLALPRPLERYANINAFPFPPTRLRLGLGPTDSWSTSVAKKPLPLRRPGFSPGIAATNAKIIITNRSTRPYGLASTRPVRPSTHQPRLRRCRSIGRRL
jgi:hypothetical protein